MVNNKCDNFRPIKSFNQKKMIVSSLYLDLSERFHCDVENPYIKYGLYVSVYGNLV